MEYSKRSRKIRLKHSIYFSCEIVSSTTESTLDLPISRKKLCEIFYDEIFRLRSIHASVVPLFCELQRELVSIESKCRSLEICHERWTRLLELIYESWVGEFCRLAINIFFFGWFFLDLERFRNFYFFLFYFWCCFGCDLYYFRSFCFYRSCSLSIFSSASFCYS